MELNCIGMHNVLNALAAFTIGVTCGIAPADITKKLAEYESVGLRQRVEEKGEQNRYHRLL